MERFRIHSVIVVTDRGGMISQRAIKQLEDSEHAPYRYILGWRMHKQKEVREVVLNPGTTMPQLPPANGSSRSSLSGFCRSRGATSSPGDRLGLNGMESVVPSSLAI